MTMPALSLTELRFKIKLDDLGRFGGIRLVFPVSNHIQAGLNKQRMPTERFRALDVTVGRNDDFDFHLTAKTQATGEDRILGIGFILYFALSLFNGSLLCSRRYSNKKQNYKHCGYLSDQRNPHGSKSPRAKRCKSRSSTTEFHL